MTHDIFSMIAIHSALLGPQAPQTKFEYVRDAIRTYNKDLHRKTRRPTLGTRGFSRVRGEFSVLAEGQHMTETGNRARKVSGTQGNVYQ